MRGQLHVKKRGLFMRNLHKAARTLERRKKIKEKTLKDRKQNYDCMINQINLTNFNYRKVSKYF